MGGEEENLMRALLTWEDLCRRRVRMRKAILRRFRDIRRDCVVAFYKKELREGCMRRALMRFAFSERRRLRSIVMQKVQRRNLIRVAFINQAKKVATQEADEAIAKKELKVMRVMDK